MTGSDDRLIVALDVADSEAANALVRQIGGAAHFFKIGMGMLATGGMELARKLADDPARRIFLDLKLFDIGATVEAAVRRISGAGPDLLTVHGDPQVVRAAMTGRGTSNTRILAVTVLTSMDRNDLDDALIKDGAAADIAIERAALAFEAGADGVICSPREIRRIRDLPEAEGKLIVTPGIRPAAANSDDQKRTATPSQALEAGADHIVVGRPITRAVCPRTATLEIVSEFPR